VKLGQIAQLVLVIVAALGVYGFVSTWKDAERRRLCSPLCGMKPNYAGLNRLAPDFELESLAGGKVKLSQYRGKVVILNFWTKTCPPCLEEMPSLVELAKVLERHPRVELVTICTDDTMEEARDTLKSVLGGMPPFTVLLDPDSQIVGAKYGTKLYPETWFVDSRGVIRARFDGARNWSDALAIDFAESLADPLTCEIPFSAGRPQGPHAALCGEFPTSG
jgi:thiol-disulfide isomerase/thioredoxin